jgi:ATP-dependent helicase/nuclease subunit A
VASAAEHEAFDPADKLAIELRRLRGIAERMAVVDGSDEALRLLRQCAPKSQGGSQSNWPPGRCKYFKRVLKDCAGELSLVLEEHRSAAFADLLQHLRDFTLAFAEDRKHAGTATFHDLLTWARDLLRDHPEVRRRAQARFDRLFVDEFQDTDPLQVEIAWFLTSDPAQSGERDWRHLHLVAGKLFIVGDPKQSIYRFRRADIGIYDEVYARLAQPTDRVVLSQSFRSPSPLVDWFNHHFDWDMQRVPKVQPQYQPLDARPAYSAVSPDSAVGPDFGVRHIGRRVETAVERWQQEAQSVARLAAQIGSGTTSWLITDKGSPTTRPAHFSDICVLIPTRTNLRGLERAFQREGVPFRMESGWLVLHTQEVRDLLSCLRAIDDPSDQVALVAALRSPAFACSDVDLLRWVDARGRFDYERPGTGCDGPVRHALASLKTFHSERMHHTPAALTEMFIRDRMLAVQAFGNPEPRDALRRLRYVVAQARTLASSGPSTLRALCDWLESRQREQYYDAESPLPDLDEDAVRFMTVHGSKGLEFPIVILTGLGVATSRAGPQSVDLVPDYHDDILKIRCGDFLTSGYARDTEKTMYEAEQRRLLYVATTRARDHLVLSLFHGKDPSHATRILERLATRPELSEELTLGERSAASATSVSPLLDSSVPSPGSPEGTDAMTPAQHRANEERWQAHRQGLIDRLANQSIIAPSRLSHDVDFAPAPDPPPEPDPQTYIRRTAKGRGATGLGCAVHAVLQVIDLATLENLEALATAAARDENIPEQVDTIAQYVRNAANSQPVQEALASGRYWREVPVGITWNNGEILEGAIDLLYATADGAFHVVDYKTDRITEPQMTTRSEEYRRQGEAYATAVERTTGQQVHTIRFVFAALGRTISQIRSKG